MTDWIDIVPFDSLVEGEVLGLSIGDHEVALYRLASDEVLATDNLCTHGQALLSDGWMTDDGLIECPLHGGCFDIRTGKGQGEPIEVDLRTYPVRINDGMVQLKLS